MRQRDFDEDQGLIGQLWVEKRVAAPVRLQSPAQVGPTRNGMNGLVCDDFFKKYRGGVPTNWLEMQKARVEPRA